MLVYIAPMKLKMWEKTTMPVKELNKETGKWEKTGGKEERTTYTFTDEFGEKLVFLGGNDYRNFEGENVSLSLEVSYNDYEKKTRVSLKNIALYKPTKLEKNA